METRAVAKGVRISPQKVRLAVDMVRGMKVEEALTRLQFTPTEAARVVAKVVKSASANAENNNQLSSDSLRIVRIYADEGPRLERFRPKARGRVSPIIKRSCHITVVVGGEVGA